METSATKS